MKLTHDSALYCLVFRQSFNRYSGQDVLHSHCTVDQASANWPSVIKVHLIVLWSVCQFPCRRSPLLLIAWQTDRQQVLQRSGKLQILLSTIHIKGQKLCWDRKLAAQAMLSNKSYDCLMALFVLCHILIGILLVTYSRFQDGDLGVSFTIPTRIQEWLHLHEVGSLAQSG